MATASKAKKAAAGTMASYAQAPEPARASAPKKAGKRTLSGLHVSVVENGYTLRKNYENSDYSIPFEREKELVFTDKAALIKAITDCLGK